MLGAAQKPIVVQRDTNGASDPPPTIEHRPLDSHRNPIGVHEKQGEQARTLDIKTALSGNRCFRLLDTAFWSFRVVDAFDLIRRLR